MKIYEDVLRGTKAVVLESGKLKASVLPDMGGKIGSIIYDGFEFLYQNTKVLYKEPILDANFMMHDTSGMDDCFPNIDREIVDIDGKDYIYPDHGETWTAQMECKTLTDNSLDMSMNSQILPYSFTKNVSVSNDTIIMKYTIVNTGDFTFPCIWTLHGLFTYHEDMEVIMPKGKYDILNLVPSKRLGESGNIISYDSDGVSEVDLTKVIPIDPEVCEKFYMTNKATEGRCGYVYPSVDRKCIVEFSTDELPYLGLWINAGRVKVDPNIAWEPTNGYFDRISMGKKTGRLPYLAPQETMELSVKFTFS